MTQAATPEQRAQVIEALKAGHSHCRAAADSGLGVSTVARIAKQEDVGKRGKNKMDPERRRRIEELLSSGKTPAQIAKLVGCTRRSALRVRDDLKCRVAS